jgi:hypothetical protein
VPQVPPARPLTPMRAQAHAHARANGHPNALQERTRVCECSEYPCEYSEYPPCEYSEYPLCAR